MTLQQKYEHLLHKYLFLQSNEVQEVNSVIKHSLRSFIESCNTPAIWCYGEHTKMLMADFIFEMKQIKYIIDAKYGQVSDSGFSIINKDQIEGNSIDGIIISSFKYKDEIKRTIQQEFPSLRFLDLYDELQKNGITLLNNYYAYNHPYSHYKKINYLKQCIRKNKDIEKNYLLLINECVSIKDFKLAAIYTEELCDLKPDCKYNQLITDLNDIYCKLLTTISDISPDNVLMFCMDGLRRKDVLGSDMPEIKKYLHNNTRFFTNAYSISTSTYESLIPAYSENDDLRTKYYESTVISKDECRFISEAVRQGRNIFFYTDSMPYIDSPEIKVSDNSQTATEKIWNFALDAQNECNGLFYIHILYESHFSYPSPDTNDGLVTDGSNIMFDYLERNGGMLRTDYISQHLDAIKYLDRTLSAFLNVIPCQMVFYADHGNILLSADDTPESIESPKYSYSDELVQIPLAIKSLNTSTKVDDGLISLMEINNIILCLLKNESYDYKQKEYIKIQRSEIYNYDFKYLYKKNGKEQELNAFEAFIFKEGYKLIIYSNGVIRLCDKNDQILNDENIKQMLYSKIMNEITVL